MCNNNQKNDVYSRFRKDIYIFHAAPSVFLIILCGITLFFAIKEALKTSSWNIGIGIMIFLGIVFAILAIISMVATYREVSRLHYEEKKEFLNAVDQLLIKLEKLGVNDNNKAKELRNTLDNIDKISEGLETQNRHIEELETKIDKVSNRSRDLKVGEQFIKNYIIDQIEGIGVTFAEKLKKEGINTVEDFLNKCAKPDGRTALAEATGISPKYILKWAKHADLFRIKGVAGQFAELLEASGVNSVEEFSKCVANVLQPKMVEVNNTKKLCKRVPSVSDLEQMIDQAKKLDSILEY